MLKFQKNSDYYIIFPRGFLPLDAPFFRPSAQVRRQQFEVAVIFFTIANNSCPKFLSSAFEIPRIVVLVNENQISRAVICLICELYFRFTVNGA